MRRVLALAIPLSVIFAACVGDNTIAGDGGTDATSCTKVCNETCVSTTDPATGCAGPSCDPCPAASAPHATASCNAGACAATCETGYADCDKNTANGCETNVGGDTKNCGKCGNVCGTANTTSVTCGSAGGADGGAADASTDGGTGQGGTCEFTCSGAYAHCGTDDSTGCETNIGTDANDCGACGHACGGGACVGGYCQPVILAGDPTKYTGLKSLYGITALGGYLYGTDWEAAGPNNGLVYKVSTTPGNPLAWIVGGGVGDGGTGLTASADFITNDGTSLTYSIFHTGEGQNAGIWNVHTDGSNDDLVVSGGTTAGGPACNLSTAYGYEVAGVAFDSSYIYWIRDTYGGCFPSTLSCQCQGVYRANANGTGVTQYFTNAYYTLPLADSGTLYMVDYQAAKVVVATSQTFTNNTPPTALPQAGTPTALQTDANYVYWLDQTNKKFYRAKKVGATTADDITPTTGMPSASLWSNFLVDANNIYFVSPNASIDVSVTQQIYVMPKDGSGPAKALSGAIISSYGDSISAWAQDATAIYWTTIGFDTGSPSYLPTSPYSAIYKIAK